MKWSDYVISTKEKYKNQKRPLTASFELTPFCNFSCNMCYIHLSPEQAKAQGRLLTTDQWIKIAEETKKLGALGIEMTGGEAVTRSDFPILYSEFIKMGYIITLRSNGYLLQGELVNLLNKYKPRCLSITLYGASDKTYQTICGIEDGFSVVTNNIFALQKAGINLRLTATLTRDNIDEKKAMQEWAEKNGFHISLFGGLITPIRAAKRSIDELKIHYQKADYLNTITIPQRSVHDRDQYTSPFWMCSNFGTEFCISWDGHMTLCNSLPSIWSDPLSQSIEDAYKELYDKLNAVKRPEKCNDCPVIDCCNSCPARLFSDTGDPEKTDQAICSIAERRYRLSVFYKTQNLKQDANLENISCMEGNKNDEN